MKLLGSLLLGLLLAGDLSLAQEKDGVEEPAEEATAEDDEAAAELVAEPESPGTEVGPPNNRQPCTMWMGGVPGTSGHSGKQGRDGRDGHDSPREEKGDTGNYLLVIFIHEAQSININTDICEVLCYAL
jgi:adiponectin